MAVDEAVVRAFIEWVDRILGEHASTACVAYNFNLYEHSDSFAVQLVGTARYDPDGSDWACDETLSSGEDLFEIPHALVGDDWPQGLLAAKEMIAGYLRRGTHASRLRSSRAVCAGFVDGDIEPVFLQEGESRGSNLPTNRED